MSDRLERLLEKIGAAQDAALERLSDAIREAREGFQMCSR